MPILVLKFELEWDRRDKDKYILESLVKFGSKPFTLQSPVYIHTLTYSFIHSTDNFEYHQKLGKERKFKINNCKT